MARLSRRSKGTTALALLAALALVVTGIGPVSTAAGGDGASTAAKKKKKKCKPGFKRVVIKKKNGKKKRKCVRKPSPLGTTPVIRATLTWTGDNPLTNLDLFAFDSNGLVGKATSNPIPGSTFSANATVTPPTGGTTVATETFTDLAPTPARNFSFGICYGAPDVGSAHAYAKIDFVTADGQHHVVGTTDNTSAIDLGSKGAHREFDGGAPIPATYC